MQNKGFFSKSTSMQSQAPASMVPKCGACQLYKKCKSPKMDVSGSGRKGILIVGEAPGEDEDRKGKPFVGRAGSLMSSVLSECGIKMWRDCWLTNALICRPPGNETPTAEQILYCRPNVLRVIRELKPVIIILVGRPAVKSVVGHLWKEDVGNRMERWVGWNIPDQAVNAWICPTYHPSFILRKDNEVADMMFYEDLKRAVRHQDRPWEQVPDYRSQIEVMLDATEAARVVRSFIRKGGTCAFDYETNMLKPDSPDAEIVSCSVSWKGKRTIAFPWYGPVRAAMRELLVSSVPKVASNMKFEHRWTLAKLGVYVQNWWVDTMQAAHVLDNRRQISGLKFQSYVNFGVRSYDDHIAPFLEAPNGGGNEKNRIHEVELEDLLLYNGLDSLLEVMVSLKQRKVASHG